LGLVRGNSEPELWPAEVSSKGDNSQVKMTEGVCRSLFYRMEETIVLEGDFQTTLDLRFRQQILDTADSRFGSAAVLALATLLSFSDRRLLLNTATMSSAANSSPFTFSTASRNAKRNLEGLRHCRSSKSLQLSTRSSNRPSLFTTRATLAQEAAWKPSKRYRGHIFYGGPRQKTNFHNNRRPLAFGAID
jgi:hypothetical protein